MIPRQVHSPNAEGWRKQVRDAFREPAALLSWLNLEPDAAAPPCAPHFPMLVPRAFAERMRPGDRDDPLLRQVLPERAEDIETPGFTADPVGDLDSRGTRGLLHKYRGRALLITTGACAVHCRYCFRREFPYASEHIGAARARNALAYIAAERSIEEIILSGGDPLMLSTERLRALTTELEAIPHVRRLRIHTRMPVILPDRITPGLLEWLERLTLPVVIVIHANHAAEFDGNVDRSLLALRRAGATVLNQAVLLAGINDQADRLAALMRRGFEAGALPYYLHLLDRVRGSGHFEVSETRALALMDELRTGLSGYLVPRLVRERAGAPYKLPVI